MKIEDELKSNFSNDYQKLIVNLYLTHSRINEPFERLFRQHGLTLTQYNLLRILRGQKQKPVSIGIIKERMIERNSDVSRIVDRLIKKKLITRTENKVDRRQKDIVINKEGLALIAKLDQYEIDMHKKLEQQITPQEVLVINDLLDKLRSGKPNEEY